ncbi:MAG: GWxTD domain-containing protein [Flavobacteriales bacterium]|nr:GWxTD domain-containing protein [Flavobacteriales bacterium]MCB9165998.1 GWxTD domain-containing protein [Flavobacteriales bacterium]
MTRKCLHLALAATALLLWQCRSARPPARTADNMAYLYGQEASSIDMRARVFNGTDVHSTIYFKLRTRDLLYKSDGEGAPFRARVDLRYEAFADRDMKQLLDSMSTFVKDSAEDPRQDKELIGSMEMQRNDRRTFFLRITATDLNRGTSTAIVLTVDRTGAGVRNDFLPMHPRNGIPLFDDHLVGPDTVRIRCDQYSGRRLYGAYYDQEIRLPAPVFATQPAPTIDRSADSTFVVQVDPDGTFLLPFGTHGFVHLRPDTMQEAGYTLFLFGQGYPYIATGPDMVLPLRYITSLQEFDKITTSGDPRKAVEQFWLDASGDRERARQAINAYYGRVEGANRYFTSVVEGWRTDRGLVHIIFGTPTVIYRSARGERWIYGDENNLMSLTFEFERREEPFSDNDMVLHRDPTLKGAWYRNVESWRNGRVLQN